MKLYGVSYLERGGPFNGMSCGLMCSYGIPISLEMKQAHEYLAKYSQHRRTKNTKMLRVIPVVNSGTLIRRQVDIVNGRQVRTADGFAIKSVTASTHYETLKSMRLFYSEKKDQGRADLYSYYIENYEIFFGKPEIRSVRKWQ